jgi:3-hydroxybutyrate dehydrogenase
MTNDQRGMIPKRALVTGAASGIGLAIGRDLAGRGLEVVFVDLPGERLEIAAAGMAGAVAVGADLSHRDDLRRLLFQVGRVDILVNNAGLQHVSPVEEFPEDRWDLIVAVMLTAPFLLTKALLPGMYERGWGRIINIASVHGLVASPFKGAYVSAKHGLLGLTKTVALEAAERSSNVTAHAICPSYVRTPLVEKQIADQARLHGIPETEVLERILLARNATKRLIEPQEVAEAVAFLCRDEAWSMNGSIMTLDAGWLAH